MSLYWVVRKIGTNNWRGKFHKFGAWASSANVPRSTKVGVPIAMAMLMMTNLASATSVRTLSFDELVTGSELVVEGKVLQVSTADEPANSRIITTRVLVEVIEVLKGDFDQPTISLSFLGGTYGNRQLKVEAMEYPQENDHGIYFIESTARSQVHPLLGWSQGHLLLLPDSGGQLRVHSRSGNPVVVSKVTNKLFVQSAGPAPPIPQTPVAQGLIMTESIWLPPEPAMPAADFKAKIKQMAE